MKAINKIKTIAALVFALSLFQACGSSSNNNNGQGGLIPAPTSAQYTGGIYSPQMQNLNGSLYYMAPYYTGTGWGYYTTNGLASCPIGYTYNASWWNSTSMPCWLDINWMVLHPFRFFIHLSNRLSTILVWLQYVLCSSSKQSTKL